MVVQHNLTAMNANRYLGINNNKLSKSLEKLSSGYAINRAGDNAAGLAVSEKMRSQIAGMTQGVKNAQDGISMVQTFEGALTETHSILQRMKTLADQMANGSYDDPVDRAASQREFLQLNDELNQIADTDFNGVIVLNGGRMADGLKQVDGKFDYANKADQVAAENSEKLIAAQAEAQSKIDAATKKVAAAQKVLNNTKIDLSNNGGAAEWNTVDNNKYGATEAAQIFGTVGTTAADGTFTPGTGGITDVDDTNLADLGATSVSITFEMQEDGSWEAINAAANDKNGDAIDIKLDSVKTAAKTTLATANGNTGLGGFSVDDTTANAVFDSTAAKKGDTVTLVFTNNASETVAPNNIGMDADSLDLTASKGVTTDPTIAINAELTDDKMTQEVADALKVLDKSNFSIDYTSGAASLIDENDVAVSGFTVSAATANETDDSLNDYDISYKLSDGTSIKLATVTAQGVQAASTGALSATAANLTLSKDNVTDTVAARYKDGAYTFTYSSAANAGAGGWTDAAGNDVTLAAAEFGSTTGTFDISGVLDATGTPANGDTFTVTVTTTVNGNDDNTVKAVASNYVQVPATSGTVTFGIAVDAFNYSSDGGYTVKAGKDTNINSDNAVAAQKALEKAKAELKAAQDAYPTKLPGGVSTSDAFNKSEAKLTYKDNITLQVGARTKDAVNFTFTYDSDVIGELKGDLDCTAAGLGTDKLTIATQEDANYAIDKIDQAINKVSLIRGNFGAIQNRLEHKIDNMNVSIENLTSAESQIRDTNMPQEMMNFTKQQILAQASQSMLAQANQLPQSVLSLLQ